MTRLIDMQVFTETSNYSFKTREEAEVFYLTLKNREADQGSHSVGSHGSKAVPIQAAGKPTHSRKRLQH